MGVSQAIIVDSRAVRDAAGELVHEGNRVPDIVTLDPLRWVVGWRAGTSDPLDATPTDQGSIRYARTTDGGRTWTKGTLATATSTHRYHYVIFFRDKSVLYAVVGRISVAEDREGTEVDGFPVRMTMKRSLDAGVTWSDFPIEVRVPDNTRGVVVAGKPVLHDGVWVIPYWRQGSGVSQAGVLRSTDLRLWESGALAVPPAGIGIEEPQVVSRGDTLVMVTRALVRTARPEDRDAYYRRNAAYSATATSTDGGLTWSPMTLDPELPNYYVKTFYSRAADGRELAIYNTLAGPFAGPSESRPDRYREVLHYKTRRPGEPWQPGRLFADGPRLTKKAARGWDVYPSGDEFAPGRYAVVWEHNQINIKVAVLDLDHDDLPQNLAPGPWTLDPGARRDATGIHLRSTNATPVRATTPLAAGCDFTVEFRGRVLDDSALDPQTGSGVSLGTKVCNGARRLMLTIQRGGVWTMRKGSTTWERVHPVASPLDETTWKVTTDSAGVARLYRNGADTGTTWIIQDSGEAPALTHWVTGTKGGNTAEAHILWTTLTPTTPPLP
ncbi:sialidase family protein [Acrocarpospora catenulata]|uniref:sialidase family protein n=1 Tax=Acrocarpospora catenulata TaxID=2836182 RepID=UPI001BD9E9BD|nr:sialidase family protein [Acrocarpospora catenulata]